jgi:hypothetical protein
MPFHHLQAEQIQRFRDAWKATNVIRESRQPERLPDSQRCGSCVLR